MGLLDSWSRRVVARREGRVEFVGEQNGPVEDTLKRELILEFATRPDIQRAYLANVGYQPGDEKSVALCIVSENPDDQLVLLRISDIVRRRFAKNVSLDIIFVSPEQEEDLARVCSPFYRSAI
jgi:hypothetical protein